MAQYTIKQAKATGWEPDQYGNMVYNVTFAEDSEQHLWRVQPANEPQVGDVVHGNIEPSKSGKATWFRRDKPAAYAATTTTLSAVHHQPSATPRQQVQIDDLVELMDKCVEAAKQCWLGHVPDGGEEHVRQIANTLFIAGERNGCHLGRSEPPQQQNGGKYLEIKAYISGLDEANESQKASLAKLIDDRQASGLLDIGQSSELQAMLDGVPLPAASDIFGVIPF